MGKGSYPCGEVKEKLPGKVHPFLQLPAVKVKTSAVLLTWICANDYREHCPEGEQWSVSPVHTWPNTGNCSHAFSHRVCWDGIWLLAVSLEEKKGVGWGSQSRWPPLLKQQWSWRGGEWQRWVWPLRSLWWISSAICRPAAWLCSAAEALFSPRCAEQLLLLAPVSSTETKRRWSEWFLCPTYN